MYKSIFRCYGVGLEHHPFLELVHPIYRSYSLVMSGDR